MKSHWLALHVTSYMAAYNVQLWPAQKLFSVFAFIWQNTHLYFNYRCDWKKRFLASSNSLCSPTFEHNTDQSPVSRSIAYCEYVRPIFQSQLLNVGPDKSNNTRLSDNKDDFGSRISKIVFVKL